MGRNRFIKPEKIRIPISDGDWIDVKKEFDVGDQRKMESLALNPIHVEGVVVDRIDWTVYDLALVDLWLVDWSLSTEDKDGKIVPVKKSLDAIRGLDPTDFDEIHAKVREHLQAWLKSKKEKRSEERTPPEDSKSSPTLPS